VLLYDQRLRRRQTLAVPAGLFATNLVFSPDGTRLAAVVNPRRGIGKTKDTVQDADDPDVIVWDTRTYRTVAQVRLPGFVSMEVAFTPDGRYLLVTSNRLMDVATVRQDGAVWRFRARDFTVIDSRRLPGVPLDEIAVSPDSNAFAVTPGDTARVFRVNSLTPLRDLGSHPAQLTRVVWSPDGALLATATDTSDGLILLWDAATGAEVAEVRGNNPNSGQIRFSADSRQLFAGLYDWTVGVWWIDPADAIGGLCGMAAPADRANGDDPPALCQDSSR